MRSFVVLNHDEQGRPQYAPVAVDLLRAGRHVWIEKPPASTLAEIEEMQAARDKAQRFVQVGFKKPFYPAIQHAKHLDRPAGIRRAHVSLRPLRRETCRRPRDAPTARK